MDPDDGAEEEGPGLPWLPPDDRLWRHPSEVSRGSQYSHNETFRQSAQLGRGGRFGARKPPRSLTLALVAGVVGAVLATGVGMATGNFERPKMNFWTQVSPTTMAYNSPNGTLSPSRVAAAMANCVVAINVHTSTGSVALSGVVFSTQGRDAYILTDGTSVVAGARIAVEFNNGVTTAGRFVRSDPLTGIAVVEVVGSKRSRAPLANVSGIRNGQMIVSLGSPLASAGNAAVTSGVISAVDQAVLPQGDQSPLFNLIEVDHPIAAAASGGPLVSSDGVIGISLGIDPSSSDQRGMGFAVPIDSAVRIADELIAGHQAVHPWLGLADSADVSSGQNTGGVVVQDVIAGSPAAQAGLVANDRIVTVAGRSASVALLDHLVTLSKPGQVITLRISHQGRMETKRLRVANEPAQVQS